MIQKTVVTITAAFEKLWDTLGDQLTQCINIVGIIAHDIAMIMGIKYLPENPACC